MYNKGDLKLRIEDLTLKSDDFISEDGESCYLRDNREGDETQYPVVFLPHSCDCWIIGGAENIKTLIADLWQALQKIESHVDVLVLQSSLNRLDYIQPHNISEPQYQHHEKLTSSPTNKWTVNEFDTARISVHKKANEQLKQNLLEKQSLPNEVQEAIKQLSEKATENLRENMNRLHQQHMQRQLTKVNDGISKCEEKLKELDEEEKERQEYEKLREEFEDHS